MNTQTSGMGETRETEQDRVLQEPRRGSSLPESKQETSLSESKHGPLPGESDQERLLKESAEWRLLGLLFECPSDEWRGQIASLAARVEDSRLRQAARSARAEAGEGLYHSIFGPGGPAPAREVSYTETLQPGHLLSELSAFYEAFAYRPATGEPADHVSVEAGFVAYLRLKEAYALACGDEEHAAVTDDAARTFTAEHLATLAGPLSAALEQSGVGYLALAASALVARAGKRAARPPERILPVLSDAREDESAFECG